MGPALHRHLHLAAAIEQDLQLTGDPDFRTQVLVRDSAVALRSYWGSRRFAQWLSASPVGMQVRKILSEDLGEPGYSNIRRRLVDRIDSAQLSQIFDLLGRGIHDRIEIHIAGSVPTLIKGLTARPTDDIWLTVQKSAIRRQQAVLGQIETEFGLRAWPRQSRKQADARGRDNPGAVETHPTSRQPKRSRPKKRKKD